MPGHGVSQVKCEPQSDEEDSNSQYSLGYFTNQVSNCFIIE